MAKLLQVLLNGWWWTWWLAAAFSLIDVTVGALAQVLLGKGVITWLIGSPAAFLALMALLCAPWLWLAVGALPALSLRVFAPPMLFLAWTGLGASPITVLGVGQWWYKPALILIQVLVLAWTAYAARRWQGGLLWPDARLPALVEPSWRRLGAWIAGHALLVPPLLAIYTVGSVALALQVHTLGYVTLGLDGLQVAHRTLTRGEAQVDLIGMVHIGDETAYHELFAPIPVEGTLVLEEGVSDARDVLASSSGGYGRMAAALGVSQQRPVREISALAARNADVDVYRFSPDTLAVLQHVFALHGGDDPVGALRDYLRFINGHPDQEALFRQLYADLVTLRNANLLVEIDRSLAKGKRVVVPWGALHLPEIELALRDQGYTVHAQRRVTLVPYPW